MHSSIPAIPHTPLRQDMSVAVVVPAYNAAPFMRRLLTSLCTNTTVTQIIVVDDASTDPTPAIVTRFAAQDARISLIRQPRNAGAGAARNAGLLAVNAKYCVFLDADDDVEEKALDEAAAILDTHDADFLVYKWYYTDMNGKFTRKRMLEQDEILWQQSNNGAQIAKCVVHDTPALLCTANFPWNKLYATQFLVEKNIRFSETYVHNDNLAHWSCYSLSRSFILYDRYVVGHKEDPRKAQLTQVWDWRRLEIFDVFDEVDAFFAQHSAALAHLYHHFVCYKHQMLVWIAQKMAADAMPFFTRKTMRTFQNVDAKLFVSVMQKDPMAALNIYEMRFNAHTFYQSLRNGK